MAAETTECFRSLLFIPGDSEKKLSKAPDVGADVIVMDLEDAVMPERRADARELIASALSDSGVGDATSCVRINPLDTPDALADLVAVMRAAPQLIMQPKISSADDISTLSHYLDALETEHEIPLGTTRIVAILTETAESLFGAERLANASERLVGLTWGAEDLAGALGARRNKTDDGEWRFTYEYARSQSLIAARAAQLQPIDTVYTDFRDGEGLARSCQRARTDGFTGKLAIHPAQVPVINEAFSPTSEEIDWAHRVIETFGANPGVGALQLDGAMIDLPHLRQAESILAAAKRAG